MRATLASLIALLLLMSVTMRDAHANGRFPQSNYILLGPGRESRTVVLRATFGMLVSYDGGATWGWICEEATNSVGTFDPSLAIGADGAIVMATPRGLNYSRTGCSWAPPAGDPARAVSDIANDPSGRLMAATVGPTGSDQLLVSSNSGATWTAGATFDRYFTETVEFAPSMPSRIYVSGIASGGIATFRRSDDGGRTTRETTRNLSGALTTFIAAVDPTNPDVIYLRASFGIMSGLLRSNDGGNSFSVIARASSPMLGFAISDDGSTVWYSTDTRADGIMRSVGGAPFTRTRANVTARCLRYHAGVLYVCGDEQDDGFLVGYSLDGADHIFPMLSARILPGPPAMCAMGTPVGMTCGPLWPATRATLVAIDAGAPPPDVSSPDVGIARDVVVATDVAARDAGTDMSSPDVAIVPDAIIATDIAAFDAGADVASQDVTVGDVVVLDATIGDATSTTRFDVAEEADVEFVDVTRRDATRPRDNGGGFMGGGACAATPGRTHTTASLVLAVLSVARRRRARKSVGTSPRRP